MLGAAAKANADADCIKFEMLIIEVDVEEAS
jgi:hypothetical protein